jgi:hypothetical protein
MPVARKPKSVDEFIHSGSIDSTKKQTEATANKSDTVQPVKLRLPEKLLQQIDDVVAKRKPAPSRHQWILEAVYEKLTRES